MNCTLLPCRGRGRSRLLGCASAPLSGPSVRVGDAGQLRERRWRDPPLRPIRRAPMLLPPLVALPSRLVPHAPMITCQSRKALVRWRSSPAAPVSVPGAVSGFGRWVYDTCTISTEGGDWDELRGCACAMSKQFLLVNTDACQSSGSDAV